jgi:type I restriction enzyme M protein
MGYIFEELIRRFNEASNEEAGDHFTPREVIRLMVNLLFMPDGDILTTKGIVKTLYDPACGTGGMLSVAEDYVRELNPDARLEVFGQDYNAQAYAICGSDMMIKGQDIEHIAFGDSFTDDRFPRHKFDYMLANPPFGVEWKPEEDFIKREHEEQGFGGRFGAGLPRINDGSLLFLMHMISKMKDPKEGGTRLGIVFNGSPLFTGAAGSGESEIRRWIIENDWLEAIVALPDQLFYNTGIYTYLWIVTNRKEPGRRGKILLVDATSFFKKMRKSLGNKRNEICDDQRDEITRLYGMMNAECGMMNEHVRVFDNQDFGYRRITVERPLRLNFAVDEARIARLKETTAFASLSTSKKRKDTKAAQAEIEEGRKLQEAILSALRPLAAKGIVKNREQFSEMVQAAFKKASLKVPAALFKAILMALSERDETADICTDAKGNPEPDTELRDYENVPLKEDVDEYMKREVLPHVPDAWVDESKTKIGYEINFNRYFYKYQPPRPLEEIEADLKKIEKEIADMLAEVTE